MGAVETYAATSLAHAAGGLGVNLGVYAGQRWAHEMAADLGATEVRWQRSWSASEDYNNPGTYLLGPNLPIVELCAELGQRPLIVAAYGPPTEVVLTVTVNGAHAVGATRVKVLEDISALQPGRDHIGFVGGPFGRPAYYGGIIHALDLGTNELVLGAALTGALASGATYDVRRLLYPSLNSEDGAAPSAQAFADYAGALAGQIASVGIEGGVELWNEPPWPHDYWANRQHFYDDPAASGITTWTHPLSPIINAVAGRTWPAGITAVNSGSHKTGFGGVFGVSPALASTGPIKADAIHPYGDVPEWHWWHVTGTGPDWGGEYKNLHPTSNFAFLAQQLEANAASGVGLRTTEAGVAVAESTDPIAKRNYLLRHLISSWALGIDMVDLYTLAGGFDYRLVDELTQVPTEAFKAIRRFMRFINRVSADPTRYSLPTVETWAGVDWPLAVYPIGPLLAVYQRTDPGVSPADPIYPAPAQLTLAPGTGALYVGGTHAPAHAAGVGARTVMVDAEPRLITWRQV